jgi:uncharacterized membrane protein
MDYKAVMACLTSRVLLLIIGFLVAFPLAALIAPINGYWIKQFGWAYQYDPSYLAFAGVMFLLGVIIMVYAYRKKECS